MALEQDEEFYFQAPPEENESIVALEASGGMGDNSDSSTINRNVLQTASRLIMQHSSRTKQSDPMENDQIRKRAQVAALLSKLDSIDAFDDISVGLPYWRTMAYLCTCDGKENTAAAMAFVQRGGIALTIRTLHDFLVLHDYLDDEAWAMVTEIFRCVAAISASSTLINFDIASIGDILACFVDLNYFDIDGSAGLEMVPAPQAGALEMAMNVFYNLSSRKNQVGVFLKENVVKALLLKLRWPEHDQIVQMAVKILTNLGFPSIEKRETIIEYGGLEQLFLLGSELADLIKSKDDDSRLELLVLVLDCMTNLLKFNEIGRKKFVDLKAIMLPNYLLSQYGKDTAIYQAAMRLTSAAFSDNVTSKEWQDKVKSWTERTMDKNNSSKLNKLLMDSLKVKSGKISFESSFTPEMLEKCTPMENPTAALKPTPEVEDVLRRVAVPLPDDRLYIRGQKLQLADDDDVWKEICECTDVRELKTRWIQELCCAALNSRQRLIVYFGLGKDGSVDGVRITNGERDEFRVGIDWALSRAFRPFLEPTMYNVEFVPVCLGDQQPKPIRDLYMIELKILHISTKAYQLDKDGDIFFRINGKVVELSLHEAGEYIAHRCEDEIKKKMENMRRQIAIMKELLEDQ